MAGKNLASLGSASQSSISLGSADVAIDGVTNFTRGADVYTATLWAPNQWWKVDLGQVIGLSKVIIVFPNDQGLLNQIAFQGKSNINEYMHLLIKSLHYLFILLSVSVLHCFGIL